MIRALLGLDLVAALTRVAQLTLVLHEAARHDALGVEPRVEPVVDLREQQPALHPERRVHRIAPVDGLLTEHFERSRAYPTTSELDVVDRAFADCHAVPRCARR